MSVAKVSAGRGTAWISQALSLVTARPVAWIGGTAAFLGLTFTLGLIPFLGSILNQLLQFVVLILAFQYAHAQRSGLEFDLDSAVSHMLKRLSRLVLMMLINIGLLFICALPLLAALVAVGGMSFLMEQQSVMPEMSWTMTLVVACGGLVSAVAATLAFGATCFATPLILFKNQTIGQALRLSWTAFRRNFLALILFALLIFIFLFVCTIPFGLGLIIGLPTALASCYVVYEELLGQAEGL